jgi:hypothetical protein
MAVTEVATGDEDSICTIGKRFKDEQCVDSSGTHDTDYSDIRRVLDTASTGKVCTGIRAPVTENTKDFWLPDSWLTFWNREFRCC